MIDSGEDTPTEMGYGFLTNGHNFKFVHHYSSCWKLGERVLLCSYAVHPLPVS